ncbi:respiratory nitrate reductase subunit gamma [Acidithiobacillus thiooxidans]|uniref:nitrate reductase (quinone) n=1 Tax=Acidithiobacillus thiooxidans ATCC 19377 TaxID=637390 RepID=A0A5P9XRW4_ACITH|nr:respiratory nitrate reductase subunit gamma [Acidithiobacillus thiooxidans]QFX96837.1 nitrate reductase [Acidithiobacillus thiooxidans ATCC 19377]
MIWSWNIFLFGIYPYIAGTIFLLGSIIRYEREQAGWTSYSSQILASKRYMMWASNLWHIGILTLFLGHFTGFLTDTLEWLGLDPVEHQWLAASAGITAGVVAMVGGVMLLLRRVLDPKVRYASRPMDIIILVWLLITLCFGLGTQFISVPEVIHDHVQNMEILIHYVRSIAEFQANPQLIINIPLIYKIHMFCGFTVFLLFPFSRLVHIWTVPLNYVVRPYQLVRSKIRSVV